MCTVMGGPNSAHWFAGVDCGGSCRDTKKCPLATSGSNCEVNADCESGLCFGYFGGDRRCTAQPISVLTCPLPVFAGVNFSSSCANAPLGRACDATCAVAGSVRSAEKSFCVKGAFTPVTCTRFCDQPRIMAALATANSLVRHACECRGYFPA